MTLLENNLRPIQDYESNRVWIITIIQKAWFPQTQGGFNREHFKSQPTVTPSKS